MRSIGSYKFHSTRLDTIRHDTTRVGVSARLGLVRLGSIGISSTRLGISVRFDTTTIGISTQIGLGSVQVLLRFSVSVAGVGLVVAKLSRFRSFLTSQLSSSWTLRGMFSLETWPLYEFLLRTTSWYTEGVV